MNAPLLLASLTSLLLAFPGRSHPATTAAPSDPGNGAPQVGTPGLSRDALFSDLDGDGRAEALLLLDGELRILADVGGGTFEERAAESLPELGQLAQVLPLDLDRDGRTDLLAVERTGRLRALRGLTGEGFIEITTELGLKGAQAEHVHTTDYDGDGWPDLLLLGERVALLRGGEAGFAPAHLPTDLPTGAWTSAIAPTSAAGSSTGPATPANAPTKPDRTGSVQRVDNHASPREAPEMPSLSTVGEAQSSRVVTPSGSGTSPAAAFCPSSLLDSATGTCLSASSAPELGKLYPMSSAVFVSSNESRVGVRTTLPRVNGLTVAGDYYGTGHVYLHAFEGDGASGTAYLQARDLSGTSTIDLQLRAQSEGNYQDVMRVTGSGRVGIGTTSPDATLDVQQGSSSLTALRARATGNNQALRVEATNSTSTNPPLVVSNSANAYGVLVESMHPDKRAAGLVGEVEIGPSQAFGLINTKILLDPDSGGGGRVDLFNSSGGQSVRLDGDHFDTGRLNLSNAGGTATVRVYAGLFQDETALLQLTDAAGAVQIALDADYNGTGKSRIVTDVVEIRGGADLAESFETAGVALEPGTVVVIDADGSGSLKESTCAYDRAVAGVVSGAGGVDAGLHLGQRGALDGETPVALTGRVYVKTSAESGSIAPGDLLTTASLAGHAMRASDRDRSHGAILGKALGSLEDGTGLVLALVSLQ